MDKSKMWRSIMALMGVIIIITFMWFIVGMFEKNKEDVMEEAFESGWTATVNGLNQDKKELLPDYKFNHVRIGDKIILRNILPEDMDGNMTMQFLIYLSTVEVKVDGETVYAYGQSYAKKRLLVGSGYHFIQLPDDAAGKPIEIHIEVREPEAFTNIMAPTITETRTAYNDFASKNLIGIGISMFLILLGGILMLLSAVAACFKRSFLRLIYIGVFSFLMGIWSMCNMKMTQVFGIDMATTTTMEYMTLYFAPVTFLLLIAEARRDTTAWRRNILYGISGLLVMFAVITTILQFLNIEHYPRFLGYFHVFGAISLVLVTITAIDKNRKLDKSSVALYIGIITLLVAVALDLVRFNLQKYFMQDNESLTISVIPIGVLFLIILLLISYIFEVYDILVKKSEHDWMAYRAYHDELCGVFNRTKCTEEMRYLEENNAVYAFINTDLNGLKSINDTFGHLQGDTALREFSMILQSAFHEVGDVYRIGGDEFLVIVHGEQIQQIDRALNRMVKLEKRRSQELPFVIDSSYGVAKSEECPGEKTGKVYNLADQRMYEMKAKKKISRRLRE